MTEPWLFSMGSIVFASCKSTDSLDGLRVIARDARAVQQRRSHQVRDIQSNTFSTAESWAMRDTYKLRETESPRRRLGKRQLAFRHVGSEAEGALTDDGKVFNAKVLRLGVEGQVASGSLGIVVWAVARETGSCGVEWPSLQERAGQ
jgi:hypothetical protein